LPRFAQVSENGNITCDREMIAAELL
jgi:hypothetical protein